jgi:hypothetical protein
MEDDDEYRNKVAIAVYAAVVDASRGDAEAAVIKTGSAFDALMMVGSLLIASSPEVNTPQKRRLFTEAVGKKLRQKIEQVQADPSLDGLFRETYDAGNTH